MALSAQARKLISELNDDTIKFGDIKKQAKLIKKDHALAQELWSSGQFLPRMLAVLLFDKKILTQSSIEALASDMLDHEVDECNRLSEWLLANQLMKDKNLTTLMEDWEDHASPVLRRLFWYYQARLRWAGQPPPDNTAALMTSLEEKMAGETPVVQWTMNFCAGQIGVREPKYRSRCIRLGKKLELYKDEVAPKNCTPNYLPEFIRIEAAKLEA